MNTSLSARPRSPDDTSPASLLDEEPSRLAQAYQRGDADALAALYEAVRPLMGIAFARYRERPGPDRYPLPAALERSDLVQQSWLILAELAQRWQPEGGSFGAYFRVSFPWALMRYVRRNSPSRRARGIVVLGSELPEIQEQLDLQAGADGRDWGADLSWAELLQHLSEQERAVLLLHLADQKPFSVVARAMRLTRPSAYRLYRRALKRVQGSTVRIGEQAVLLDAASLSLERQGHLIDLVQALHRGADPNGRLPGRAWLLRSTALSEPRLTRLIALLVSAGCVRGRAARRPGRLVFGTPAETLAALGIGPASGAEALSRAAPEPLPAS